MAKFAWWYGMFQYIWSASLRVEYIARISSVTTLYIDHWKVFETLSHADRQTDRQTDRFLITVAETHIYKLRIPSIIDSRLFVVIILRSSTE